MEQVTFKFALDERVTTPFHDEGFVSMLGFDERGCVYFVKTSNTERWFKESQLKRYMGHLKG